MVAGGGRVSSIWGEGLTGFFLSRAQDANVNVESLRTLAATFPIPAGTVLEAPRAITAAEREVKAFTALRMARSDGRYVGVRAERQKKRDEEEAAKKK